jgi:hypothetical protein
MIHYTLKLFLKIESHILVLVRKTKPFPELRTHFLLPVLANVNLDLHQVAQETLLYLLCFQAIAAVFVPHLPLQTLALHFHLTSKDLHTQ